MIDTAVSPDIAVANAVLAFTTIGAVANHTADTALLIDLFRQLTDKELRLVNCFAETAAVFSITEHQQRQIGKTWPENL